MDPNSKEMSKYLCYLLSISLVCLACEDDEPSPFGREITAIWNGEPWTGQIYGIRTKGINGKLCELPTISIAIDKFKFNSNMSESNFDITFTMLDGSEKTISNISPTSDDLMMMMMINVIDLYNTAIYMDHI